MLISSSEKVNFLLSSHQNSPSYFFRTVLAHKQCLFCAYFSPDSDETTFSLEKATLWIEISYFSQKIQFKVKNILMMDLFPTNTQILAPHDNNCSTGVMWIMMFLSAVWTLILTAPIHCRGSICKQVM